MQSVIRYKKFLKRNRRDEIRRIQDEIALSELAVSIKKNVSKITYSSVQSLRVATEHDCIKLSGFCESYYIKQLAQQAVLNMATDKEIVNEIAVL